MQKKGHDVHPFLTIFRMADPAGHHNIALYYNVHQGDDTYNYYISPDPSSSKLEVVKESTTGMSQQQIEDMSRRYAYFTNEYLNQGRQCAVDGFMPKSPSRMPSASSECDC